MKIDMSMKLFESEQWEWISIRRQVAFNDEIDYFILINIRQSLLSAFDISSPQAGNVLPPQIEI